MEEVASAYIHIPFCHNICSYCDFCKMYYDENLVDSYLDSLKKEIIAKYQKEPLTTIYIGGGTPSCLSFKQLDKLFSIINLFIIDKEYEFTFECNISDIKEDLLIKLKENRVNRISIGIETINKKFYKLLNRYNDEEEVLKKIALVKKYFSNINIDLMYAFSKESMKDLDNDLNMFMKLDVPHISIYSLILEQNTKLYIDKIKPISEDLEAKMYYHIIDYLKKLGYEHYEISNFAKKGYASRHNLTYWNNLEYYGFGLGSSGFIKNVRYTNTRSIKKYLNGNYVLDKEKMDLKTNMENEMILGLRKIEGVEKNVFYDKYHFKIEDVFDIIDMVNKNLLEDRDGYIFIPESKLYLSNSILINFIGGSNE